MATIAVGMLALAGRSSDGGSSGSGENYDSPIINEDVPKMDIKNLSDIEERLQRQAQPDLLDRGLIHGRR